MNGASRPLAFSQVGKAQPETRNSKGNKSGPGPVASSWLLVQTHISRSKISRFQDIIIKKAKKIYIK